MSSRQPALCDRYLAVRESEGKSTFIGDGDIIAGTMQNTNDDDFVVNGEVVDRVFLVEDYAQIL